MRNSRLVAAATVPALSLMLAGCFVSQSKYDALNEQYQQASQQNQQLTAQNAQLTQQNQQLHAQVASLQAEQKWVEAGDLLFPSGGWQLSDAGKADLDNLVPKLTSISNAKIVVYGYTDNHPVLAALKKQGISNNLDLSLKRAGEVVNYLVSKGVDANLISAKGRGDTHPVASNSSPAGRAQNRRIEIVLTGPGAS
jgi:chemotaxis protein MotB